MENSNKQLFTRLTVYVIVFVLVTVSYINFTNSKENNLEEPKAAEILSFDATKNIETTSEEEIEEMEEIEDNGQVLGEIDINDFVAEEEPLDSTDFSE